MSKRSIASLVSALFCLALLNGCSSNKQKPQEITEPTEESVRFEISAFSDTPSSEQEDWAAALSAFKISCRSIYRKTAWAEACSKASVTDPQNAEAFFKIISLRGKSKNARSVRKPEPFIPFLIPAS